MSWLRRLWPYLRRHTARLILVFVAAVAGMGVTALVPLLMRAVVDDVLLPALDGAPAAPAGPLLAGIVALGAGRFVLAFVRRYHAGRLGIDVEYDLRNDIYDHLHRLDFARHDEMDAGQLVSRANSDVRVVQVLLGYLPFMSGNVVLFVASLVIMVGLSVPLTLVALAAVPVLAVMAVRLRSVVYPSSWDAQQRAADVASIVEEATSGVRVVKVFGQERRELARLRAAATALFGSRMRNARLSARRQASMQAVPAVASLAILGVGGWLVLAGSITLGTLLAFQAYLTQLVSPVRMVAGMVVMSNIARAAAERIFELLDSTPEVRDRPDAVELPAVRGAIELRGVRFGYLRSEPVLDGLDLSVAPGEVVALVGASGSGTSTVSLLIGRFYDVQEGSVRIDGVDVRGVRLTSLRSHLGVVFEDSFLFSDTVRANIAYGRPDATDEDVARAARRARADGFIRALPDGYDTVVGERGLTLSGGQRRRIALARALVTDPAVLLLDDATSSVDVQVEREIHRELRHVLDGRTAVVVARRRSTLDLADRIVVLDAGRVVDTGTRAELTRRCELFRRLLAADAADLAVTGPAFGSPPVGGIGDGGVTAAAWARIPEEPGAAWSPATSGGAQSFGGGALPGPGGRLAMPPTRELNEAIATLPPVVDTPSIDLDAEEDDEGPLTLRRLLGRQRGRVAVATILVGLSSLLALAGPYLVKVGVDDGLRQERAGVLWAAVGAFAVCIAADRAVTYLSQLVSSALGENLLLGLRVRVFAKLQRLGLDFYDREMTGRVLTRMTSDLDALQSLLQTGIVNALVQAVTLVGALAVLVAMSPMLSLVVAGVIPPLVVSTLLFRRRSAGAYGRVRDRIAAVNATLQESISGVREAHAFNRQARNIAGFRVLAGEHRAARIEGARLSSAYFPFVELLSALATAAVLWAGLALVPSGAVTVGTLFAFVLYLTAVFAPVQDLSQVVDTYQQGAVALDRLRSVLTAPVSIMPPARAIDPGRLRGEVRLDGVSFTYAGSPVPALHDVDLSIGAGETLAVVGPTGAGKSTVAKLVARLHDPDTGRVLVDGVDLRAVDSGAFRRQLGVVPQDGFLFGGTVRDNIAYGRPDATDAQVEAAARAVGAHDLIAALPFGYHQPVVARGRSFSAGERQLIALARAQLVDPAILVLDEATANLDLATEASVLRAMRAVGAGRTTLVIAHRLHVASRVDRIAVLDHGRVVEVGSHRELARAGGVYAGLWSAYADDGTEAIAI